MKTIKIFRIVCILAALVVINSRCSTEEDIWEDPVYMINQSDDDVFVIFAYYVPWLNETMLTACGTCLPGETFGFTERRHKDKYLTVKVYGMADCPDMELDKIADQAATPIAEYVFTRRQLLKHECTFTYPPSEPWKQSGINDIRPGQL